MDMNDQGQVLSFDLHKNKLSLIEKGAERLGLSIIKTEQADASKPREELFEKADVLLLDAPCSGLGVLAKKPELRYKNVEETARLPEIQEAILENACRYVKKGGRMIYSTCTLLQRENEDRYFSFLNKHPEFEPVPLEIPRAENATHLTLFPDLHGTDGFFISAMRRKN
jgi:16S rRNA (cytosine967-C5)-methyltransferase